MKFNKIRYMVQIPESIGHFIHGAAVLSRLKTSRVSSPCDKTAYTKSQIIENFHFDIESRQKKNVEKGRHLVFDDWKRSFSTVFTLNMKKILPMIDCSLSITRFVT